MAKLRTICSAPPRSKHKWVATFLIEGRERKVSFGAAGYEDFTMHRDTERKDRYLARHAKHEHWDDPMSPGALSRWILWNKPSLRESIKDYRQRFGM